MFIQGAAPNNGRKHVGLSVRAHHTDLPIRTTISPELRKHVFHVHPRCGHRLDSPKDRTRYRARSRRDSFPGCHAYATCYEPIARTEAVPPGLGPRRSRSKNGEDAKEAQGKEGHGGGGGGGAESKGVFLEGGGANIKKGL